MPVVAGEYYDRFRARVGQRDKWDKEVRKKALEIARYALPIATFTYMYHTISGITLLRYWRLCNSLDAPSEQRLVVGRMVEELLRAAPEYEVVLHEPIPLEETPEFEFFHPEQARTPQLNLGIEGKTSAPATGEAEYRREFDASLDGRVSKLIDWKQRNELILAEAVREVLGVSRQRLGDDDAIDLALNPARNRLLGDELNLTTLSKLTRALVHPGYTFRKKLSHTGDSQDQRHRMTPASRPCLHAYLTSDPDFITPEIVRMDSVVETAYADAMNTAWEGINHLRRRGVADEFVAYLLPNAVAIRFTESADLMSLHHKHAMRLCYNAQEEIWRASKDEAEQVREVNPRVGRWLLPPCGHRFAAGSTPICPEGVRFCGIAVWKLDLPRYRRVI
jgi:thymidylate synthase ThyX